jgi:hypothetical protein
MPCGLPSTKPCKYIYVARNPKDVVVSLFHFLNAHKLFPADWKFSDSLSMFMKGDVGYGSWFDHVLGWWAHRDDPNILFLKYEDMQKDLADSVQKIATFIGSTISEEQFQDVVKQCEFKSMKSNPQANYSWNQLTRPTPS